MATKVTRTKLSVRPKNVYIKLQNGTDNTLFATWTWTKKGTTKIIVDWDYYAGKQGPFPGTEEECTPHGRSIYTPPSNATRVRCRIKAEGKSSSTSEWYTAYSDFVYYYTKHNPSLAPGTPTVTIEDSTLTAELSNIVMADLNAVSVSFSLFRVSDDKTRDIFVRESGKLKPSNNFVRWVTTITRGNEYKVRAFTYNADGDKSDPSDYSSVVGTIPKDVAGITNIKVLSTTSVRLDWKKIASADKYEIEYATDKKYFDSSSEVSSATSTTNYAIITGLESGKEYFFRVRATNENGESEWTNVNADKAHIILGKTPAAPTTWSSTTTAIVGEPLYLYWVHNSEDASSQESAILELTINGVTTTETITNDRPEEEKDKTSTYKIDTSAYYEGVQIKWRVKTKGIMPKYGDWSVLRTIDVYAKPTVALSVTDDSGVGISTLTKFPINIYATTYPKTQKPISYYLTVLANESYETVDEVGNVKMVSKGDEVYRGFFDISTDFRFVLSADNIDLEGGMSYTLKLEAAMNSGLVAEDTHIFSVSWIDFEWYSPELELTLNEDDYSMLILPFCAEYPWHYWKVKYSRGVYVNTGEEIEELEGEIVEDKITTEGTQVYKGTTASGEEIYFTMIQDSEGILIEGVTLSVYRREFDGSFSLIGKGIPNDKNSYITDPHPALDYARYRVIATDTATGHIVYSDVAGLDIGCPYVIIQWNDSWTPYEVTDDTELLQDNVSSSMLMIKGNIDVSDKYDGDVSLIEYIGRKRPVAYYGTQLGETSSWSMEIPKSDKETLYALRRLAIWMGDCYVREPSGSGYWARVSVSFNQKHRELTIPITLDVKRVEGGM